MWHLWFRAHAPCCTGWRWQQGAALGGSEQHCNSRQQDASGQGSAAIETEGELPCGAALGKASACMTMPDWKAPRDSQSWRGKRDARWAPWEIDFFSFFINLEISPLNIKNSFGALKFPSKLLQIDWTIWDNFRYWLFLVNLMNFELELRFISKFESQRYGHLGTFC
jgi:hypothetical protein